MLETRRKKRRKVTEEKLHRAERRLALTQPRRDIEFEPRELKTKWDYEESDDE